MSKIYAFSIRGRSKPDGSASMESYESAKIYVEVDDPDKNDSGFYLTFQSSFINGGYYWSHPGPGSWKEFLPKIGLDYFATKIMGHDAVGFDYDLTVKTAIEGILRFRRKNEIDEDTARVTYDWLRHDDQCGLEMYFQRMMASGMTWEDADCFICYTMKKGVIGFWEKLWPVFLEKIKDVK